MSYLPGFGPADDHPTGWQQVDGSWWCLGCIRERLRSEPGGEVALVDLELRRDPKRPNGAIAAAAGSKGKLVALRRRLLHDEEKPPIPKPKPEKRQRRKYATRAGKLAEDALRENPARLNREIAEAVGVSENAVKRARHRLEAVGEIPRLRGNRGGSMRPESKPRETTARRRF